MSGFSFMTVAILFFHISWFSVWVGKGEGEGGSLLNRDFPKFVVSGSPLA